MPTPAFSLKDGVAVDGAFKVRATDVEERMPEVTAADCSALSALTPPELPTATAFVDPALGTAPTVTAAPAVIAGVVVP